MAPPEGDGDEDFAALLNEYAPSRRREAKPGDLVRGRIVSIGHDAVFIDMGDKSEGMIEAAELRDEDGKITVKLGDVLEARVVETGGKAGCVVLRRTLGKGPDARAELEQAHEHGIPVEGVVTQVNKGGVEVQIAGVRAFCPISQLDLRHVEDANAYVGQRFTFRITRLEKTGRNVNLVVSRRALLEEEAARQGRETRARLEVGSVVKGKVSAVKDYGAFVDLGGLEGMLHVSEMGFSRVERPAELLAVGQEIEVQILKIEKSDDPKRPERISLSLKSLEKDPWGDASERFPEGARLRGKVTRVESFGAFVELAVGVEGLVHISELGGGRPLKHAREAVKVGHEVEVIVTAVDRERRRLSLAMAPPGDAEDVAHAPAAPRSLGTFGDLLQKQPQGQKLKKDKKK
jgi:small subunit ribosomal protein S1